MVVFVSDLCFRKYSLLLSVPMLPVLRYIIILGGHDNDKLG